MLFMTADISVVVARSRGLVLRFATQTPHHERVLETGAGIFSPKLMAFCSSVWEGKCCCFFFTSRGPLLPIGGGCWWWWSEWFYFNLISIYCTFKKLFFTPGTLPPRFPQRRGRLFLDQTWRHHLSVGRRTGKMWPPTLVINIYWRDYCYWLPRAWG